jgi:hypothetical protein
MLPAFPKRAPKRTKREKRAARDRDRGRDEGDSETLHPLEEDDDADSWVVVYAKENWDFS